MTIPGLFAYVGPDTFMPVASAISALVGALMCFWGTGMRTVVRGVLTRFRRDAASATPAPALARHRRSTAPAATQAVETPTEAD